MNNNNYYTQDDRVNQLQMIIRQLKEKCPPEHSWQFLSAVNGIEDGVYLYTVQPNGKACTTVAGNAILLEAKLVESTEKIMYIATKWKRTFLNEEVSVLLTLPEFENNKKMLVNLGMKGISLLVKLNDTRKAELLRQYIVSHIDTNPIKEVLWGWNEKEDGWSFFSEKNFPWWNRNSNMGERIRVPKDMKEISRYESIKGGTSAKLAFMLPILGVLQSIFDVHGLRVDKIPNLICDYNDCDVGDFLSRICKYENATRLPCTRKQLESLLKETKGILPLKIREGSFKAKDSSSLIQNLEQIQERKNLNVLPVLLSQAPITCCTADTFLEIPLDTNSEVEHIADSEMLLNCAIVHIEHTGKMIDILIEKMKRQKFKGLGAYRNIFIQMEVISKIIGAAILVRPDAEFIPVNNSLGFFASANTSADWTGIAEIFLDALQECICERIITVIDVYSPLKEGVIIAGDSEIYFRRDTLEKILKYKMSGVTELSVLHALFEADVLKADISRKICYLTRRRCTNAEGKAKYLKCIVLKKEKIVECGCIDIFHSGEVFLWD